jgi:hypothetical protein
VSAHFEVVVLAIIAISVLPIAVHAIQEWNAPAGVAKEGVGS